MATWFCPKCFHNVTKSSTVCPKCGTTLAGDSRSFEQKLIAALHHPLPDRRLLAAQILGRLRSKAAVPAQVRLARDGADPYLASEAVRALGAIGGREALSVLREIASTGPAVTRAAAKSFVKDR